MKTKKVLSFLMIAVMLVTSLVFTSEVSAGGGSIVPDKAKYTINEDINVTVSGVSQAQMDDNAFAAIYKKGDRHENFGEWKYVIDMIGGKWKTKAPSEVGEYELRLYADESYSAASLITSTPITITYITDKTATVKADKAAYTPGEDISIITKGVTEAQMKSDAYVSIYKKGDRHENYGDWKYVIDMIDGKWSTKAPSEVGDYEIRLYAAEKYVPEALYISVPIKVTYTTTEATLTISKNTFAPMEKINIKVGGVTEAQKKADAFVAIYKKKDRHENYGNWQYVINMIEDKWETTAPYEVGEYELRLYAAESYTSDALLITVPFTVSGQPVEYINEGTNGISGWAVTEVQEAIKDNLTTDRVMIEFQKAITREEFCELAVKLYEAMTGKIVEAAPSGTFADTNNAQVLKAYKLGIVAGVGGDKFAPNNSVTRQEIATMLLRTVKIALPALDTRVSNPPKFIDGSDIDAWASEGVYYFASKEIIKGANGAFLPKANCTCEAAIALVKRVFDAFAQI